MFGNVKSSNERRPKVSIVHTAGHANAKFTKPNPQENRRDESVPKPACEKIVEE